MGQKKGFKHSEETKARIAETSRVRWQDAQYRKLISDKLKAQAPEIAERMRKLMTGRKITWGDKISASKLGCKRPDIRGEKNRNWKGGVTRENEKIRKSFAYMDWRRRVLARDKYICQLCGVRGGKLQVDHIKPFALYPALRLELSNGRTLCFPCHVSTPTYLVKPKRSSYAI